MVFIDRRVAKIGPRMNREAPQIPNARVSAIGTSISGRPRENRSPNCSPPDAWTSAVYRAAPCAAKIRRLLPEEAPTRRRGGLRRDAGRPLDVMSVRNWRHKALKPEAIRVHSWPNVFPSVLLSI